MFWTDLSLPIIEIQYVQSFFRVFYFLAFKFSLSKFTFRNSFQCYNSVLLLVTDLLNVYLPIQKVSFKLISFKLINTDVKEKTFIIKTKKKTFFFFF